MGFQHTEKIVRAFRLDYKEVTRSGFKFMMETDKVRDRYSRREDQNKDVRYDRLDPRIFSRFKRKNALLIRWVHSCEIAPLHNKSVLEIGCGKGDNLLQLLRLGFLPENLIGNELLESRVRLARHRLPEATRILDGDASALSLPANSFDIVFQSTVRSVSSA
jgi:ubiquinone/menaquinone biosynthesis C-methylase UbiE